MNEKNIESDRDRLVRIETILKYNTDLLEENKGKSDKAIKNSIHAIDEAGQAKWKADYVMKELDKYKKEQKNEKRTLVTTIVAVGGILVTIIIFLTPIVIAYYIE